MDIPAEGGKVAYVGDGGDDLAIGDEGKVLSAGTTGSHVMWSTGARQGQVTLTHNADLVMQGRATAGYEHGFDAGLVSVAVRDVYATGGAKRLLAALNQEGHLAAMTALAEEALQGLCARIRTDPSMREVLAVLEPDEGAEVVSLAATALLREAAGS